MPIAVLDIGKTNAKLVLVDADGNTLDERRTPNTVLPGPPYPHFDTDALWRFVLGALAAFAPRIDTIVPVTHGACAALVDEAGLVLPVLDYEHGGPDAARASYAAPPFDETGSPSLPGGLNVGAQLHWLEATRPDAFEQARTLLFWPQYWGWRLTGVAAAEVTSLGCHTDLWAPQERRLSSLARRRGWDGLVPPLRSAWDPLGPVTRDVAGATGLDPATVVLTGIHDSNASLLPYLDRAPCTVLSTGTWVIAMALGGTAARLDPAADMLLNVSADGRAVPTARFMGGRARDRALRQDRSVAAADRAVATEAAARIRALGGQGDVHVEGPFAASGVFLETLASMLGRTVIPGGDATGTVKGAALLAARAARA